MIRYFEKVIQRCPDTRVIFDGDYVDRNPDDLENVTLIMAFWMQYPDHVRSLRGNHEDHLINNHYGFVKNIKATFPDTNKANHLYQEILTWFMKLPLGHLQEIPETDGNKPFRIFCCHAGIPIDNADPYSGVDITTLNDMKTQVTSFKEFPPFMTWMLWADPEEGLRGIEEHPDTGRDKFGEDVFDAFLNTNHLDLMVRAHEVLRDGYQYFFHNRLISLFSASSYKNMPLGSAKFAKITHPPEVQFLPTDSTMLDIDLAQVNCEPEEGQNI